MEGTVSMCNFTDTDGGLKENALGLMGVWRSIMLNGFNFVYI
jgi:hypothetical protein